MLLAIVSAYSLAASQAEAVIAQAQKGEPIAQYQVPVQMGRDPRTGEI